VKAKLAWVAALAVIALALALAGEWSSYAPVRARARTEPWRESPDWQDTFVTADFFVPALVLKAFAVDLPAPEERKKRFADYLAPNARYRCLRWVGSI